MGQAKQRSGPAKTRRHRSNVANTTTKIHPNLASFHYQNQKFVDNSDGNRNRSGHDDGEDAKRRHRLDRGICDSNAPGLIQSLSKPLGYSFTLSLLVGTITGNPIWSLASLSFGLFLTSAFIGLVFIFSRR